MSKVLFRSPRTGSVAAALAPDRLAREFEDGDVLWRENADGQIEVATMRDGHIDRYVVHDDGRTSLVGSQVPTALKRWASKLAIAAWGLLIAAVITAGANEALGVAAFVVAFAFFAFFGARAESAGNLRARLKKWAPGDWHHPTKLNDWTPRSTEQLAAVENIADAHDGLAFVHDVGASTVEVQAMRKGKLERFWVDATGRAALTERTSLAGHHHVDRGVQLGSLVLWLAFLAALLTRHWLLAGIAVAGFVTALVIAALNNRQLSLERRMRKLSGAGERWTEIRTVIEEDSGE